MKQTTTQRWKQLFERIVHFGVEARHSRIEKKQIWLANFLSLLLLIMAFPYVLFHAFFGSTAVMLIMICVELSHALVLFFNWLRMTVFARYFFVLTCNVALFSIILVLGEKIHGHLLFFPFVMFPMLFFGLNRMGGIVFGVLCSFVLYFLLVYTDFATPFYFPLTPFETAVLKYSLMVTAFAMLVSGTLYWSWLHEKVEKELEESSQAKSRFLANMSHELRTPLNAIMGYTELLQEEGEEMSPEEVRVDLQRVHGAADKLLFLIDDLLDLSKIEANQMELVSETFASDAFFAELEGLILPMMQRQNNTFELVVEPGFGDLTADRQRLEQILLNLLSNAAKFTEDGTVSLRVRRRGGFDCFEVEDNGIGIPEAELPHLFDVFKQASIASRPRSKRQGTGLGLSIARQFSELMGGDISVESTLGEGTTFLVRIRPNDGES